MCYLIIVTSLLKLVFFSSLMLYLKMHDVHLKINEKKIKLISNDLFYIFSPYLSTDDTIYVEINLALAWVCGHKIQPD